MTDVGHTEQFTLAKTEERNFDATITAIRLQSGTLAVFDANRDDMLVLDDKHPTAEPQTPESGLRVFALEPANFAIDFTDTVI